MAIDMAIAHIIQDGVELILQGIHSLPIVVLGVNQYYNI
jgi:2-phosphoglycerate kinase